MLGGHGQQFVRVMDRFLEPAFEFHGQNGFEIIVCPESEFRMACSKLLPLGHGADQLGQ